MLYMTCIASVHTISFHVRAFPQGLIAVNYPARARGVLRHDRVFQAKQKVTWNGTSRTRYRFMNTSALPRETHIESAQLSHCRGF